MYSGNPLGTRYMPCQAASEGIFSVPASSSTTPSNSRPSSISRPTRASRPLHPSSPRYWNCRPTPTRARTASQLRDAGAVKRTPSSASSASAKRFYVYTFFSDRVQSVPVHDQDDYDLSDHDHVDPSPSSYVPSRRPPPPTRSQTQYLPPRVSTFDNDDEDVVSFPPPLPASFLALTPQGTYTASPLSLSPLPVTTGMTLPQDVFPTVQLYSTPLDSPAPRSRGLEDAFDTRMQASEQTVLDPDGVVIEDGDGEEMGEGDGDGDKVGTDGRGFAWGGR